MSKYAILATSGGVWPRMTKSALLVLNIANFGPDLAQMSLLGCFGGGCQNGDFGHFRPNMVILSVPGLGVWTDLRGRSGRAGAITRLTPPYSRHPPFMSHLATFWVILDPSNSVSTLCKSGPKSAFWVRLWGILGPKRGHFHGILGHFWRCLEGHSGPLIWPKCG